LEWVPCGGAACLSPTGVGHNRRQQSQAAHPDGRKRGDREDFAMTVVRRFLLAVALACLSISATGTAAFSAYPDRPIRWILSHPPGGSADVIARLMQPKLEKILGQPLIIENRAGAGGIIAMDALSKSKPDGYTIGMGASGSLATSPALGETVPYNPIKSFQPIAAISGQPFMLAVPGDSSIKSLRDVIDIEKRGNSSLTIGHGGAIMHLTAALFNYATGLNITLVAYKGTGPVVTDLLGAHIPLGIIDIPSAEAALASGKAGRWQSHPRSVSKACRTCRHSRRPG
jgi:tripartite-type tricarboxylate transporter receptor subunit TctC